MQPEPKNARPARRSALALGSAAAVLALVALTAAVLAPTASAQGTTANTCQKLQDTRYWRISHPIVPMPNPEPRDTQRALDGFEMTTSQNADGTIMADIEVHGRADNESGETTPDKDDITVDTSKQVLYFLEGDMGDDAYARDTDLGDEAVVLTDLQGCILN